MCLDNEDLANLVYGFLHSVEHSIQTTCLSNYVLLCLDVVYSSCLYFLTSSSFQTFPYVLCEPRSSYSNESLVHRVGYYYLCCFCSLYGYNDTVNIDGVDIYFCQGQNRSVCLSSNSYISCIKSLYVPDLNKSDSATRFQFASGQTLRYRPLPHFLFLLLK